MPKRIGEEEAHAPFWLLTMGDMNNLMMVFFIMLFALLMMDKVKYLRLEGDLKAMSGKREEVGAETSGDTAAGAFEAMATRQAAMTEILQIRGQTVRFQRLREGTALTLGAESEGFDEGDWALKPGHKKILDEVKRFLVGTRKYIEIRGHTSGEERDAVIVEPGIGGPVRVRRITDADLAGDPRPAANWPMLGWLRANEVRNYLIEDRGDGIAVRKDWIRLRSDGYTNWLTQEAEKRAANRRVEVVLTDEPVREK